MEPLGTVNVAETRRPLSASPHRPPCSQDHALAVSNGTITRMNIPLNGVAAISETQGADKVIGNNAFANHSRTSGEPNKFRWQF